MRIGYFADGVWAHKALDKIITSKEIQVAFIVARADDPDPVLQSYAERMGIKFLVHPKVNSNEFLEALRRFQADLHVSMSFNQILKEDILRSAPLGFINCHGGALPFYRGRNILNWALLNGETQFGVTVHYVDAGIDTGDIILQRFAPIDPDETYRTVLDKATTLCAEVLFDALNLIAAGKAPRIPQTTVHPVGFYCSRRRPGDEWLDWSWSSKRIHNFVRSISPPGPGARTTVRECTITVVKSELIAHAPDYLDKPGAVVGTDAQGCVVKTGDNTIRITSITEVGASGELLEPYTPSFPVGTILGIAPLSKLMDLNRRISELERRLGMEDARQP